MSFSDCWNENVVAVCHHREPGSSTAPRILKNSNLFFSISGSVVLESFASKDLSSSCSLTTAVLVASMASEEEEEEDDELVVSE